MSIKERKERERDERRDLILNAASKIIKEEGIDNLSIRKIAASIEYSPAIIYHYFQDKDDIVNHLMKQNYQKIISVLSSVETSVGEPTRKLREMSRKYIDLALQMPDEYMSIMFSSSPRILEHTSVLFKGASGKRQAIGMLCQYLKEIYTDMEDNLIELTAQVLWTATFGLIIRLIIEKDIDEEQRNNLIEHHIKCTIDGMLMGKSLSNS
jgi:AcrR family transcriptional regulator